MHETVLNRNLISVTVQARLGAEGKISLAPKERDMLAATQWNDGKIQATPYGHFAHFEEKVCDHNHRLHHRGRRRHHHHHHHHHHRRRHDADLDAQFQSVFWWCALRSY